jgi:hypothetical protein
MAIINPIFPSSTGNMTKKKQWTVVLIAFLLMSIISTFYSYCKYKSLNFHPRDYPFYFQTASKLFDQSLTNQFSLNQDGHNFFGYYGTEGVENIHQTLHFEPVKYIYALLYKLFKTPVAIFIFSGCIFFFPVVYFSQIQSRKKESSCFIVSLFTIFYLFSPLALRTASYDLRPFVFLVPLFTMLIFSIHFSRPTWENILLFNSLFIVREEALMFAFVATLYAFAKESSQKKNFFLPKIFAMNWLLYAALLFTYYSWAGFPLTSMLDVSQRRTNNNFIAIAISVIVLFTLLYIVYFVYRKLHGSLSSSGLMLLTYSLIFIPVFLGIMPYLYRYRSALKRVFSLLFSHPRFYFFYFTALVFIVLVWDLFLKNRKTKIVRCFFWIVMGGVIIFTTRTDYTHFRDCVAEKKAADIVFSLRENTDKYKTALLCDYSTYQAFCDYENVFCYNRLPCYIVNGAERYYPSNIHYLKRILERKIEYVVLSIKESKKAIKRLNLDKLPVYAKNKEYVIYKRQ